MTQRASPLGTRADSEEAAGTVSSWVLMGWREPPAALGSVEGKVTRGEGVSGRAPQVLRLVGANELSPPLCTPGSCGSARPRQILMITDAVTDPKGKQGLQAQGGQWPSTPHSLRGPCPVLCRRWPSSALSTGPSGTGYVGFLLPSLALSLSFCPVQVPRISCHLARELYLSSLQLSSNELLSGLCWA